MVLYNISLKARTLLIVFDHRLRTSRSSPHSQSTCVCLGRQGPFCSSCFGSCLEDGGTEGSDEFDCDLFHGWAISVTVYVLLVAPSVLQVQVKGAPAFSLFLFFFASHLTALLPFNSRNWTGLALLSVMFFGSFVFGGRNVTTCSKKDLAQTHSGPSSGQTS